MNIEEVKERKEKMEFDILEMVSRFMTETGLVIDYINLEVIDVSTPVQKEKILQSVNIEVSLP